MGDLDERELAGNADAPLVHRRRRRTHTQSGRRPFASKAATAAAMPAAATIANDTIVAGPSARHRAPSLYPRGISRQRVPCGSAAGRLVIWTLELGQSTCRISRSSGRRTHARSGSWALAARTLQGSARRGSTAAPRTRNSKCKCGPVALPVAPTRPITVPTSTRCPTRTVIYTRWA